MRLRTATPRGAICRLRCAPSPSADSGFRIWRALTVVALFTICRGVPLDAQDQSDARIRAQQEELSRIRREREELQRRMRGLQSKVHDISEEVTNLDRQHNATVRVVRSLDQQLTTLNGEVEHTTANLVRAQDEVQVKRAVLRKRLVEIYKRGPLYTFEVMLAAQSFGDLVARYKYLHILAQRDRAVVARVDQLRAQIIGQRRQLVSLQNGVEQNRVEKAREAERLSELEQQRQKSLARAQQDTKKAQERLKQLARSEARLNSVIEGFENARRRAAARRNAAPSAPSSIRTSDLGNLDWPVDGSIIYRFGRVVNPNNTTTRWNGIGIAAASGTEVKSVSAGEVVLADVMGTYGNTIIIEHGGGDYSVYGSLSRMAVSKGSRVTKGQSIGAIGATDPSLPPHLHFEIRRGGPAVDPLSWLRGSR
ncbi:MAG TPA: peptidoglycan DD-metalloendopeptidase family protein [Gemmatimonadaceae bacterium]|nr:peptidoglycan DD-metalloendopeptidase family protein [Gemmatimonadaceae bacterium]